MKKTIKFKGGELNSGWILTDGRIVPFEFLGDKPVRWLNTSYHRLGEKLKDPSQDFYVQLNFYERAV